MIIRYWAPLRFSNVGHWQALTRYYVIYQFNDSNIYLPTHLPTYLSTNIHIYMHTYMLQVDIEQERVSERERERQRGRGGGRKRERDTLHAGWLLICKIRSEHIASQTSLSFSAYPKGPCAQIVNTLAPKYLCRDYFKSNVYTIWPHGPILGESGDLVSR